MIVNQGNGRSAVSYITFGMLLESRWPAHCRCFFINAGPNTTISPTDGMGLGIITNVVTRKLHNMAVENLLGYVLGLVNSVWQKKGCVAISSDSCTIYPTILKTLSVPSHQSVTFTLVEGIFVFEGRYHRCLRAKPVRARPKTRSALQKDKTRPSHNEMHIGNPLLTIREAVDFLEVLCSFKSSGYDTKLDLEAVILGYIGMRWTDTCHHPMADHMGLDKDQFATTSIASPAASARSGVVMTRWNPIAQFLCCERGYQAILVKNCCVNCAAEGLDASIPVVFIVG